MTGTTPCGENAGQSMAWMKKNGVEGGRGRGRAAAVVLGEQRGGAGKRVVKPLLLHGAGQGSDCNGGSTQRASGSRNDGSPPVHGSFFSRPMTYLRAELGDTLVS